MQCVCLFDGLKVGRTQLLGENHLRVLWEPDQASESNLLLLVVTLEREQPFLLGLQLHETSGHIDASIGSRTQLRICPVICGLGIFDLHALRIDRAEAEST